MCKCYRCGTCCKGFNAMIPKNANSNLSPEFLENLEDLNGFDSAMEYVENNSELQGKQCKWLRDEADGTTSCLAYNRRSSDCRNYPDYTISFDCRIGKRRMDVGVIV